MSSARWITPKAVTKRVLLATGFQCLTEFLPGTEVCGCEFLISEGVAHRATGAAHPLFACLLRMTVRLIEGFCCLAEVMAVTQLVRHIGEHVRDGGADGKLAVADDADNGHRQGLFHLA